MQTKIRDSRIELLRIVSMVLIVVSHFSLESVNFWQQNGSPMEAVKLMYFDALGQPGAIIFFVISGYFYYQNEQFESQKNKATHQVWKTWSKTFMYSIIILLFAWFLGNRLSLKQIATAILPFSLNEYWFITCYIILILLSPWINQVIRSMSLLEFKNILILFFILMFPALLNKDVLNNLLLAFSGYFAGAFIRKYKVEVERISNLQLIWISIAVYIIMLISIFVSKAIGISTYHSAHFTHFPLSYILAICVFVLFLRLPQFENKLINILASGAFAVYLITVHPLFYTYLWVDIIHIKIYKNLGLALPFIMIGISILIYIICATIDILISKILAIIKIREQLSQ